MSTIVRDRSVAPSASAWTPVANAARRVVRNVLTRINHGSITIHENGAVAKYGNPDDGPQINLRIHDQRFYNAVAFDGSVGAGEAYIEGYFDCDDIAGLVELLIVNEPALRNMDGRFTWLSEYARRAFYLLQRNTRSGSKRNIHAHYDLGDDFFRLFLDESMTYSSGIFESEDTTLAESQTEKIDRACRKLQLAPDDHLLEIGTGWGSAAIHAARNYGCRVTTTTISHNQFHVASERVKEAGLDDRIDIKMVDYRDLDGTYDKLLSIEMVEAVGHQYIDGYFEVVSRRLAPHGMALIQAITIRDQRFHDAKRRMDFLKKYIFPGSCLLSVNTISRAVADHTDMSIWHMEDIGPHYATTLERWRHAFNDKLDDVRSLGFDDRFIRMWNFYLMYCEGAFRARHCGDFQVLLAKPNARAPLTAEQWGDASRRG